MFDLYEIGNHVIYDYSISDVGKSKICDRCIHDLEMERDQNGYKIKVLYKKRNEWKERKINELIYDNGYCGDKNGKQIKKIRIVEKGQIKICFYWTI